MDMNFFRQFIAPRLVNCELVYSSYPSGDFGSLERVIIKGNNKIAGIDIWSKGWLDIDIYDLSKDEQIMTLLLDPTELDKQNESINILVQKLCHDK